MKNQYLKSRTALAACLLALSLPLQAADPAEGAITEESPTLSFTGGPFPVPNVTPQLENEGLMDPVCTPGEGVICDAFDLTLDLPEDYYAEHPDQVINVTMTWDAQTGQEDYDFYLYDAEGNIVNQGEGTSNPESMSFCAGQGLQNYRIVIFPFTAILANYTVQVEMITKQQSRCKAPKADEAPEARNAGGSYGGALGLGLLLPLAGGLMALRRRRRG